MAYGVAVMSGKPRLNFQMPEARSTKRNYGLDAVRAVAILLVLLCHGLIVEPRLTDTLFFYWTGFFGVELFFVLSGYLIGSILFSLLEKSSPESPFRSRLPRFWIRRWFRTLPNYYFFLAVNVLLALAAAAAAGRTLVLDPDFPKYLLFLQNLFRPIGEFMGESWSLAVEEWFYITFPLFLLLITGLKLRPRRAFGLAAAGYIVLFVGLRTLVALRGQPDWDYVLRKIVAIRLDSIAYGALMMLIMRAWPERLRKLQHGLFWAGLLGIGLSILIMKYGLHRPVLTANLFTLTSLGSACLLPYAVYATEQAPRSRLRTIIAGISIISYSLYLAHMPALRLTTYFFRNAPWPVQYAVYLVLSAVAALVVYTLYERRMTSLRDRFGRKSDAEL